MPRSRGSRAKRKSSRRKIDRKKRSKVTFKGRRFRSAFDNLTYPLMLKKGDRIIELEKPVQTGNEMVVTLPNYEVKLKEGGNKIGLSTLSQEYLGDWEIVPDALREFIRGIRNDAKKLLVHDPLIPEDETQEVLLSTVLSDEAIMEIIIKKMKETESSEKIIENVRLAAEQKLLRQFANG